MSIWRPINGVTVIGIGHKARHGKDTAARILQEQFPGLVRRFAFADDLYAVCRVMHGMSEKDGSLLQRVGIEHRERDADVWIRSVHSKIADARPYVAVITDVRFPNEMAFVRALGGKCWKVERRLIDGSVYVDPSRTATHVSETAVDGEAWDRVIVNPDGGIEWFRERVLAAFWELTGIDAATVAVGPCAYLPPRKIGL